MLPNKALTNHLFFLKLIELKVEIIFVKTETNVIKSGEKKKLRKEIRKYQFLNFSL